MERSTSRSNHYRNLAGFWLLGLTNNYAYVVMLSAAHDILSDEDPHNSTSNWTDIVTPATLTTNRSGKLVPECNTIGTGAVLLADVLPSFFVKLVAPFFVHLIPYSIRVATIVLFTGISFPIVSFSAVVWVSLVGVVCASFGSGLGELSFLSLSSYFDKNVISTWSSGTGAAGVGGALSYAGLTAVGVSPRNTLLIMLIIPILLAVRRG